MKDEKQYKWVDVTGECELKWKDAGPKRPYIAILHGGVWAAQCERHNVVSTNDDYRIAHEPMAGISFRIERRVEVEQPKPETVKIYVMDRSKILGEKRISYQSAKELGLI